MRRPLLTRLMEKVDPRQRVTVPLRDPWCWVWTRNLTRGYGYIGVGSRAAGKRPAHVVAYELFVGPVPEGLELDHLCRTKDCANPAHCEAVPHQENLRRGNNPRNAARRAQTHCIHGHEFTTENTIPNNGGGRACRTCHRETNKRYRARLKDSP